MSVPEVHIVEVGPRDGLQAIPEFIPTAAKIDLINDLAGAGLRFIEAASFVNPRVIPQMRDASEVMSALDHHGSALFSALVPNQRGLEAALRSGVRQVGLLAATTESYSQRNTNTSVQGALDRIREILQDAKPEGVSARGYVSCAVACPYEGPVDPATAARLAVRLADVGCDEIVLADTVGSGTPQQIAELLEATLSEVPVDRIGVHLHDTFGQALANAEASLRHGVRRFDTAVAGLGGSPTAPGAGGNLPTEDLVFMVEGMGLRSGVDIMKVAEIGTRFCEAHGITHQSRAGRALIRDST